MNVTQYVEDKQTSEFYPTPPELVAKMLDGIDWTYVDTILEPSAGKGDILREVARRANEYKCDVDCIELDQNLRQILKYNFSDERKRELTRREKELEPKWEWDSKSRKSVEIPSPNPEELQSVIMEKRTFFKNGIHIVHDDFLTYDPFKRYSLIIMNPPFSNGEKHLLKALEIQRKGGGIICLLNAETIRNPYTELRKALVKKLDEYNASIEYIEDAFTSAERRTDVEIALIKVSIEQVQEESDIYNRLKEAEGYEEFEPDEKAEIEVTDFIKAMVNRFKVEVKLGLELIRTFKAAAPYMTRGFGVDRFESEPILRLTDSRESGYDSISANEYLKIVRLKYWKALLTNPKFVGKLTSTLQQEYQERVVKLADYDFSEFNIRTLSAEMVAHVKSGVEQEIIVMYDRLTYTHSYYPEFSQNKHYYNGWKTNEAYKIGKKSILPCHGVLSYWSGRPDTYKAREVLEDIERILNFLDGHMTAEVNSWDVLQQSFAAGITKNIQLKYFKVTFYKKGTVHITYTCPELIDRFNIYAAQNKNWLPPSYGKKAYKNMTEEERKVVDDFQGEKAYNEVMAKSGYYLAPVVAENQVLMLGGA